MLKSYVHMYIQCLQYVDRMSQYRVSTITWGCCCGAAGVLAAGSVAQLHQECGAQGLRRSAGGRRFCPRPSGGGRGARWGMHCTSEPQVEAAIDVRKVWTSHCKNHALTANFQHCICMCTYVFCT